LVLFLRVVKWFKTSVFETTIPFDVVARILVSNNNDECFIYWDLDAVPNENGNRWRQAKNPLRVERIV